MSGFFRYSVFFLFCLFILNSCDSCRSGLAPGDGLSIIPADAPLVAALNLPALAKKGDLQDLQSTPFYSSLVSQATIENPAFADILRDPGQSGVNLKKQLYFSYDVEADNPQQIFSAMVISLSDVVLFEKMLKKVAEAYEVKKGKGYKYMDFGRLNQMAWNDHFLIFGSSTLFIDMEKRFEKYFSTNPKESIASNPSLWAAISKGRDITLWATTEPFAENPYPIMEALGLKWLNPSFLKDNYLTIFMDFVEGAVELDLHLDFQENVLKKIRSVLKEKQGIDLNSLVISDGLFALFNCSLSMEGLYNAIISDRTVGNWMDGFFKKSGLSPDDLTGAFGGNLMLAGYKDSLNAPTRAVLAMDVKDYDKAKKVVSLFVGLGYLQPGVNGIFPFNSGQAIKISLGESNYPDGASRLYLRKDVLFISGIQEFMDAYQRKATPAGKKANSGYIRDNPGDFLSGYFNMYLLNEANGSMPSVKFDNVTFNGDLSKISVRLEFKNKEVNALKQFLDVVKAGDFSANQ